MPLGDPVLDAAVRYFGAHGLRSTALEDVARSSELDPRELSRRYPTSRALAIGIFERMLDILGEQLGEQRKRGATLTERLQRWFELELQLLAPCKALVRGWLLESVHPLSPAALLQGPLAFRYAAQIQRELELARDRREISGWILPVVAAGAFIGLRRSLLLGWLADDSPASARTLPLARAEITAFVQLLAPWPGLDEARPTQSRSNGVPAPRALSAPSAARVERAAVPSEVLPTAVLPSDVLPGDVLPTAVLPTAVSTAEAAPAAAVDAALAQAPAVLGTLAQAALEPEPARFDSSPAPVKPDSETSDTRAKRRARAKRSKH